MKNILILVTSLIAIPGVSFGTTLFGIQTGAVTSSCTGTQTQCQGDDRRCEGSVAVILNPNGTVTFSVQDSIVSNEVANSVTTCTISIDNISPGVGQVTSITGAGSISGNVLWTPPAPGNYSFRVLHSISKSGSTPPPAWTASGNESRFGSFTVPQIAASIILRAQVR